jgi:hypothetical protein
MGVKINFVPNVFENRIMRKMVKPQGEEAVGA